MKDSSGRVIGFEKLNFTVTDPDLLRLVTVYEGVSLNDRKTQDGSLVYKSVQVVHTEGGFWLGDRRFEGAKVLNAAASTSGSG